MLAVEFLILVAGQCRVERRSPEGSLRPGRSNPSIRFPICPSRAEIPQVDSIVPLAETNGKIGQLHIAIDEAELVQRLQPFQRLTEDIENCTEAENSGYMWFKYV